MANINTIKNAVEIRSELKANGTKVEYIVINGQKCGIMGSVNEADREAALKALNTAYAASNGDIYEMMEKLATIATIEEKEIKPDEMTFGGGRLGVNNVTIPLDWTEVSNLFEKKDGGNK